MTDAPRRAAVGAAIDGHEYQHLVALTEVLDALRSGREVATITIEARDAAFVDDVVVTDTSMPPKFVQAKHGVDGRTPVGTAYLTALQGKNKSLLKRFHESWRELHDSHEHVDMVLVTDRDLDADDPLMRHLDRKTGLLVPAATGGGPRTARAAARRKWSDHLTITEDELVGMLAELRFQTGVSFAYMERLAEAQLAALGRSCSAQDIKRSIDFIRDWTTSDSRTLAVEVVRERIFASVPGAVAQPDATLVVEAFAGSLFGSRATESVDFTGLFAPGDVVRRQLDEPANWQAVVWPELKAAGTRLLANGHRRVLVLGAMRQGMWFTTGVALKDARNLEVLTEQRGQYWDSANHATAQPPVQSLHGLSDGPDLAIAVGVTDDPTADVAGYLSRDVPRAVGSLLTLTPPGGVGAHAVADGPQAAAFAEGLRDAVRQAVRDHRPRFVHLFLLGPAGLALLLGWYWNSMPETIVYEHAGGGQGYFPTVTLPA